MDAPWEIGALNVAPLSIARPRWTAVSRHSDAWDFASEPRVSVGFEIRGLAVLWLHTVPHHPEMAVGHASARLGQHGAVVVGEVGDGAWFAA
jgi:hypothetical protein